MRSWTSTGRLLLSLMPTRDARGGFSVLALGPTTVRLWSSGARSEPKGPLGWFMFVVGWGCIFVGVIFLLVGALR